MNPCSQITAQLLLLLAQIPQVKNNSISPQISTPKTQIDGDQRGLQLIKAERRQNKEMLELLMMVMEAKVRLQEEEKKN